MERSTPILETRRSLRAKLHEEDERCRRARPLVLRFLEGKRCHTVGSCNCCGSTHVTVISEHDRYGAPIRAAQCQQCGLVFLLDRLSKADYAEFYESAYRPIVSAYLGRAVTATSVRTEQERYAIHLLQVLRGGPLGGNHAPVRRLLDVGGSTGVIASAAARELNSVATVLDPSGDELRFAAASGHQVIHALLEDWVPAEDPVFDLTFCCKTVDHFLDLRLGLLKLRQATRPEGLLVIDIIDFDVVWRRKGMVEGAIKMDHCYYLSSENAPAILRSVGLEPILSEVASHPERVTYVCRPASPIGIPPELSAWTRSRLRDIQTSRLEVIEARRLPYTWRQKAFAWRKRLLRPLAKEHQ